MGMDGLFRPGQLVGHLDTLGHLDARARALEAAQKAHRIQDNKRVEDVRDEKQKDLEQKSRKKRHEEYDARLGLRNELKSLFAEAYGIDFDPANSYYFFFNETTQHFELIDGLTEQTLLSLTPQAFIRLTEQRRQDHGMMTDHSA